MNRNRKQKKDRSNEHLLEKIVFATAILNLVEAIIDLIKEAF